MPTRKRRSKKIFGGNATIFQNEKLAQALLLTCRHKVRGDTRREIETGSMDASLNIIEASNRTEPKQPTTDGSQRNRDGNFASVLSGTQNKETSKSASQRTDASTSAQTRSTDETATNSPDVLSTVPGANNTQPSAPAESNTQTIALVGGSAVVNTSLKDTLGDGKGSADSAQNNAPQTKPTSTVGAPPVPITPSSGKTVTSSPAAQTESQVTSAPTAASSQASGANPQIADNPIVQAQTLASTASAKGETPLGQNEAGDSLPAGVAKTDGALNAESKLPGLAGTLNQSPPATIAETRQAETPIQATPQNAVTPQNPATPVTPEGNPLQTSAPADNAAASAAVAAVSPAKTPNQTKPASTEAPSHKVTGAEQATNIKPNGNQAAAAPAPVAGAQTAPTATPQITNTPEPAVAQQQVRSPDATHTERPANAAIDGLKPQTNPNAAKTAKTNGTQSSQTSNSQTQNSTASTNAGTHQVSIDTPVQPVRNDVPLEIALPMDVDGAPELLTTAGLQERVHNNLPQTTLNLRFAPGQSPVIAPNDLALHIARQVQDGVTRFEIRIDPPEMGRIEVQMDMKSQKPVQAHLFVERAETLDLLQRDARQLERALQNLGIDVDSDSLSFSLRDGNTDTAGQNGKQNNALQNAYQADEKDNGADLTIPADIPMEAYGFRLAATQGINIQV